MSIADGRSFFFARSCREGTGFSGRLMPAGHLLFGASKKEGKKLAGNAIPRSRLPSERKIAHSRVGSLYPCFDTNVRNREYFLNIGLKINFRVSGQPGATPGEGLKLAKLVWPSLAPGFNLQIKSTVSCIGPQSAGIGHLQPGWSTQRHRASRGEASGPRNQRSLDFYCIFN